MNLKKKTLPLGKSSGKPSVSKQKKLADKWWSQYIRLRDADQLGYANCISCGAKKHWKTLQNGHFVSRSSSTLRFDEENCNAQCVGCNMFKQGNQYEYAVQLDLKYGEGTAKKLHAQRHDTHKFTLEELDQIIHDAKEYISWREQSLKSLE